MTDAVLYCDGACEPKNPGGVATYGWVAYWNGKRARSGYGVVCQGEGATNNVAEYTAVIRALEYLKGKGYGGQVKIYTDSQLIVNQINGLWRVNKPALRELKIKVSALCTHFDGVSFEWVPRDRNREADELSRRAYYEHIAAA